ncbi:MAG TPA: hypothetical protein VLJ13_11505 [Brevundimonas sp.]|nr:hypothetical protein [Brevundimonas sp.]
MKMARSTFVFLVAVLAGCAEPAPTPEAEPAANATASTPGPEQPPQPNAPAAAELRGDVATLAGAWRVAGIDGAPLDEPVGLALTGDGRQLWWEPRCAGAARAYRIDGARISFASTESPRPVGAPTPPVCTIGLPPRLGDVMRALDEAESISRTESNGVLIVGPTHSVTLYSQ